MWLGRSPLHVFDAGPANALHLPAHPPAQVNLPEEAFLRSRVMDAILGPDPHRNRVWLPGSQPVSLDSSNKSLLEERPYWCGWMGGWVSGAGG